MRKRKCVPTMANRDTSSIHSLYHDATHAKSKNSLRAWLYLMKCAKRIDQEMTSRLRVNYASSMSRFDVLAHLYLAGNGGLSTTQLAKKLLASKGNITRLLDRMEHDDLLIRRANQKDRRISDIILSERGREVFARMAPDHEAWADELFHMLSDGELDELVRLLRSIHEALD